MTKHIDIVFDGPPEPMTATRTDAMTAMREERRKNNPLEIVQEFEYLFGKLTLTERKWLVERIAASQVYARRA